MLKYALLALLSHKAMTGYELEQFISTTIAHFWTAKLSQVYRTLKQLEEQGLVNSLIETQGGKPDKRIYTVTDEGKQSLGVWQNTLITDLDDLRKPSLMRFFFFGNREIADVLTQLKVWQTLHRERIYYFQNQLPDIIEKTKQTIDYTEKDAFYWEATRKLGQMYEETNLKWLEMVLDELETQEQTNK